MKRFSHWASIAALSAVALVGCATVDSSSQAATTKVPGGNSTSLPELVKIAVQLDKGDYHGSYGCLEVNKGFGKGTKVGGPATGLLTGDFGGHHSPNGVDTLKIEVQYPAEAVKGSTVTFTISGVEVVTTAGTTNPSPFPASNAGGINWFVKGPGNLGGKVVDNKDGSYTVTAVVDDHRPWSGSANQVAIASTITDSTVDVSAYTVYVTF